MDINDRQNIPAELLAKKFSPNDIPPTGFHTIEPIVTNLIFNFVALNYTSIILV